MPVFFTNYCRPPNVVEDNQEDSKTLQQFKQECDINYLIARYAKTGFFYDPLAQAGQKRMPQFGDFSNMGDFAEQQNRILAVYDAFAALPAATREKFGHNPATFVEFVGNPENAKACVEMGIFPKAPEKETVQQVADPAPVPVVNEPPVETK